MSQSDFTSMSDHMANNNKDKPDPTFLADENTPKNTATKKSLGPAQGLTIEKRQQTLHENDDKVPLTRRELENLLDDFYADGNGTIPGSQINQNHAEIAGGRMVRNLTLISSFALLIGFGVGFYTLSQQGGETAIGQKFNQTVSNLWQAVLPATLTAGKTSKAASAEPGRKPIKMASIIVADASGQIETGIPLKLELKRDASIALVEIKIMNVPADAVLTAGVRRQDGVWILQPDDLAKVELVMSSPRQTPLRLDIELVEAKTGELLSPPRAIKVAILKPTPFQVGGL